MEKNLTSFERLLREEEKSQATIEKYLRDIRSFIGFIQGKGTFQAAGHRV